MDEKALLAEIKAFADEYYAYQDFAHNREHGQRTATIAVNLNEREGGDPFLVEAGAWLHQFHDDVSKVRRFLEELDMDDETREALLHIVEVCRPDRIDEDCSLEARIVFDADALEVLGCYGAVREILCNYFVRGKEWEASIEESIDMQKEFRGRLMTGTARCIAVGDKDCAEKLYSEYNKWKSPMR